MAHGVLVKSKLVEFMKFRKKQVILKHFSLKVRIKVGIGFGYL